MRHSNGKRPRGRSGRRGGGSGPNANRAYDSNGPNGKLRGTAAQLVEKYTALARDARAGRDRVLVENFLQHAEHYQRLLNELQAQQAAQQAAREEQPDVSGDKAGQPDQPAAEAASSDADANGGALNGKPTQDEQPVVEAPVEASGEAEIEVKPKPRRRRAAAPEAETDTSAEPGEAPSADA